MSLNAEPSLMPLPAKYTFGSGRLAITENFNLSLSGQIDPRLHDTITRFIERLSRQTGITFPVNSRLPVTLAINCNSIGKEWPALGDDESYTLIVDAQQARLNAPTTLGVLHGLETILQLVQQDERGFAIPAVNIDDRPRFPWRGLMLDVCRHWMPIDVVKRTLDGMAAVKLNVFHWHLSEDQGFRIESKRFPKLHERGSDGHYFTRAQVREVIQYARDRGIRVVPEFDMPGHATSWLVGYPELGTDPGPYQIERHWGIFDPAMDPTKESTYRFLDAFIGEMAALFPDEYFHIGGDELNGKQWSASAHVQAFLKQHGLKDNQELHRYFNTRLHAIVHKHGKRMEGWDEILDPALPKSIVIQSWRGQKSLNEAARQGYSGLLSAGYYLDLMQSTEFHYLNDPLDEESAALTPEQRSRILGGEMCMWTEFVTTMNVDQRIWPRAAAIAERLWSPQSVRDVRSMYARLARISRHLETTANLVHRQAYRMMLERLAGADPVEPVRVLADIVEPVKLYTRGDTRDYTSWSAYNRMVDAAHPESDAGREFRYAVEARDWTTVRNTLTTWRDNGADVRRTLESHALLTETIPVSENLTKVAVIGLQALDAIEGKQPLPAGWNASEVLNTAKKPVAELLLMAVPGVEALVSQASGTAK